MPNTLKVLPVGTALVHNFERHAQHGRPQPMIGRTWDEGTKGYLPSDEPVEVPLTGEYVRARRVGDLEPADEATARVCGLEWPLTSNEKVA